MIRIGFVIASAMLLAPASAGAAPAKLDASSIKRVSFESQGAQNQYAGGFAGCPGKTRAFGAGGFWYEPEAATSAFSAKLSSLAPAIDGSGAIGSGYAQVPGDIRHVSVAHCAPRRQLRGAVVKHRTLSSDAGDGYAHFAGARVSCPGGTRAIGGGAGWHPAGADPLMSGTADAYSRVYLRSSTPTANDRGWFASGVNGELNRGVQKLTIVVVCLSRKRLGRVRTINQRTTIRSSESKGLVPRCPKHTVALAGGAYFAEPGLSPRSVPRIGPALPTEALGSSVATAGSQVGWYANGANESGSSGLTFGARVLCLDR